MALRQQPGDRCCYLPRARRLAYGFRRRFPSSSHEEVQISKIISNNIDIDYLLVNVKNKNAFSKCLSESFLNVLTSIDKKHKFFLAIQLSHCSYVLGEFYLRNSSEEIIKKSPIFKIFLSFIDEAELDNIKLTKDLFNSITHQYSLPKNEDEINTFFLKLKCIAMLCGYPYICSKLEDIYSSVDVNQYLDSFKVEFPGNDSVFESIKSNIHKLYLSQDQNEAVSNCEAEDKPILLRP